MNVCHTTRADFFFGPVGGRYKDSKKNEDDGTGLKLIERNCKRYFFTNFWQFGFRFEAFPAADGIEPRFLSHHLEALRTGKLMPRTAGAPEFQESHSGTDDTK